MQINNGIRNSNFNNVLTLWSIQSNFSVLPFRPQETIKKSNIDLDFPYIKPHPDPEPE